MANNIGFGQGSVNNTIGWGQATKNNTIGYGEVEKTSWSPETNITGIPEFNEYSMIFDGVDEYFTNSGSVDYFDDANKHSISVWVKLDTLKTNIIYRGLDSGSNVTVNLYVRSNGIVDASIQGSSANWSRSTAVLVVGQWYHIGLSYDNTRANRYDRLRIYVNGVKGFTSNFDTGALNTTNAFFVGGVGTPTNSISGKLDEFSIWKGIALQDADFTDIYNSGVPTNMVDYSTTPTAYYRFGDGLTWGGKWTMNSEIGSYDLNSVFMEEADRVTDVP